jgi:hypothetical protein
MGMTQDTAYSCSGRKEVTTPLSPPYLLGLGATVYAISFALPAVTDRAYPATPVSGWLCAWVTLASAINPERTSLLLSAIGLINPMALTYVVLRLIRTLPRLRRVLAIITLCLIPLSWYLIAHGLKIQIGHIAWVAGLLLMLLPEAIGPQVSAHIE